MGEVAIGGDRDKDNTFSGFGLNSITEGLVGTPMSGAATAKMRGNQGLSAEVPRSKDTRGMKEAEGLNY